MNKTTTFENDFQTEEDAIQEREWFTEDELMERRLEEEGKL